MDKLFVYGTLGPGKPNEHILKKIGGSWEKGYVLGQLHAEGWGADMGYPGIRLENQTDKIFGHIFTSNQLDKHWAELDQFEGAAYERVLTKVFIEGHLAEVEAYIYALK